RGHESARDPHLSTDVVQRELLQGALLVGGQLTGHDDRDVVVEAVGVRYVDGHDLRAEGAEGVHDGLPCGEYAGVAQVGEPGRRYAEAYTGQGRCRGGSRSDEPVLHLLRRLLRYRGGVVSVRPGEHLEDDP